MQLVSSEEYKQNNTVRVVSSKGHKQTKQILTSSSFPFRDRMKILISSDMLFSFTSTSTSFWPDCVTDYKSWKNRSVIKSNIFKEGGRDYRKYKAFLNISIENNHKNQQTSL